MEYAEPDPLGVAVFGIALVCAPIAMVVHIIGVAMGVWPAEGIFWWISLCFLLMLNIGVLLT